MYQLIHQTLAKASDVLGEDSYNDEEEIEGIVQKVGSQF